MAAQDLTPPYAVRIAALIKHRGLSQADVARRAGMPDSRTLWRWTSGKVGDPEVERLQLVAEVLGTTIDWLNRGGANGPIPDPVPGAVSELDATRAAAVEACLADTSLSVPPADRPVLEELVRSLAASDGLAGLTRALTRLYRGWLEEQRGRPSATARSDEGRATAGATMTGEAKTRGEAKGHATLPKKRGR